MADERQSALREQPGCPVPRLPRAPSRRRSFSADRYIEGILRGDRTTLAQAITLIESSRDADRTLSEQILETCLPHSGHSIRVGITGVPGAGKSSVIEALGTYLITELGAKVAVLAVDPSSRISGGSILGDKTRMEALASSDLAFIRPSPSRGSLGGVAQRTREAMLLCEAAGYRNVLIETVGVGQSEAAVHNMVDFFLLLGLAGAGDELQGIKRGVMELADLVAINKADGTNRQAAEKARNESQNAFHFLPAAPSGWTPRALVCSAHTGKGIRELWHCVQEYVNLTQQNGWFSYARQTQAQTWMHEIVDEGLHQRFEAHPSVKARRAFLEKEVQAGRVTSFRAARELLELYADAFRPKSSPTNSTEQFESEPTPRRT